MESRANSGESWRVYDPSNQGYSSAASEDEEASGRSRGQPAGLVPRLSSLQARPQLVTSSDDIEDFSFPRGAVHSPQHSRLQSYTAGHRPFSQGFSPRAQPLLARNEVPGFAHVDDQTWLTHAPNPPPLPTSPPSAGRQGWGMQLRQLSPPPPAHNRQQVFRTEPSAPQHILPSFLALEARRDTHILGLHAPTLSYPGLTNTLPSNETRDHKGHSPALSFDTLHVTTQHPADESKSPLPQNLRGDPFRSAKVKTELCRYYNTGKGCVFGDKCNYAHGEHELKFNKLIALEQAGLVDVEVFRTHPCFTWIATGACPFDQRCTRLHDPRVNGIMPSWLPHAEVLVNNTGKSMNVDKLYHQQFCAVYSCSPVYGFAPKKKWKADEASTSLSWKEFYSFCCNMDEGQPYSRGIRWPSFPRISDDIQNAPSKRGAASSTIETSEMQRLAMALKMRERRMAQYYTYLPSHVFCGELCMVLQTCYFKVEEKAGLRFNADCVVEITEHESTNCSDLGIDVIVAREIAFGPVADASVRQVSIWFNVSPDHIVPCTRQQARRHKRSRHRLRAKRNYENQPEEMKISSCCSIPPFFCHQPVDDVAFDLITGIQTHRFRVLQYFSLGPDIRILRSLASEEERLRGCFESQRRFWMTWTWPKRLGSSDINDNTDVPPVDGVYRFVTYGDRGYGEDVLFFGEDKKTELHVVSKQAKLASGFLWKSFVMNLQLLSDRGAVEVPPEDEEMPTHDPIISRLRRVPLLRRLSLGAPASRNSSRALPRLIEFCSFTGGSYSLDAMIHRWEALRQEHEENSSNPLREAQIGKDVPTDPTQRRSLTYPFNVAAKSKIRVLPQYS